MVEQGRYLGLRQLHPAEGPLERRRAEPLRGTHGTGEILREDHGWEPVSLEIQCRPSGDYQAVAFNDAVTRVTGTGSGFQVVLDPDYQLPQPGLHQEPGTAPPAGDADVAATRFRAYLERRTAILGRPDELPPPATAAAIPAAHHPPPAWTRPDLRYLSLTGRQWTTLMNAGKMPPSLNSAAG